MKTDTGFMIGFNWRIYAAQRLHLSTNCTIFKIVNRKRGFHLFHVNKKNNTIPFVKQCVLS